MLGLRAVAALSGVSAERARKRRSTRCVDTQVDTNHDVVKTSLPTNAVTGDAVTYIPHTATSAPSNFRFEHLIVALGFASLVAHVSVPLQATE